MSDEPPVSRRRPPVKSAGPAPELSGLELTQLRTYREELNTEEDMVSYWWRLLQGRIDLLETQARFTDSLSLDDLVRVLGDTGSGRSRRMLMRVHAPTELPNLPDLEDLELLWAANPHDLDETADVVERLKAKERMLNKYRRALHERIEAATGEVIVRYRADPRAALRLLPRE